MDDGEFAATVHRVQLRQQRVQRERAGERQRAGAEVRERAARIGERGVADGRGCREPVHAAAQHDEDEAALAGGGQRGQAEAGQGGRGGEDGAARDHRRPF